VAEVAVLPGAEPFSAEGGPHGALVLHGFTGSPQSMRGLAEAFAAAGFAVELPRLPGHGTTVEDMGTTSWADWSAAAEEAYEKLSARCDKVVVAGLSMGGTLTCWLATRHPGIAGIVVINGAVQGDDGSLLKLVDDAIAGGVVTMPAVGNDIAAEGVTELAYDAVPVAGTRELLLAVNELEPNLRDIRCPVLIMNSPQDHVVPPAASDHLAEEVSGPVERVTLQRSFHVATLDHDKDLIEERAVAFARRVTGDSAS
jgi:carboxylesterase